MKYVFDHSLCTDFNVYEKNRLPGRACFIPFSDKKQCLETPFYDAIEKSSMVIPLSGEWDFKYYPSYRAVLDIETEGFAFDKVPVSSMWQYTGYEHPWYLNTRYQFPVKPPVIPNDSSFAVYRRIIDIKAIDNKYILTFLGVAGALAVYVNGQFAGYGEGSHNTQEFDITDLLKAGANELLAVVYKWSNGSYLEAQDMFRNNGIFREVYITRLNKAHINDFKALPVLNNGVWTLKIEVSGGKDSIISAELLDKGNAIGQCRVTSGKGVIEVPAPKLWSAESPYLYKLLITNQLPDGAAEYITSSVGFKTVRIEGEAFTFNGKAIKLLGVNHHDTNPMTGYYMTYQDMLKDVTLMKELNVNAVRTSHYPPHPFFLELCSIYGLYIIDEADIETHGCYARFPKVRISSRPEWIPRYTDRVRRMYERDKNSPCVTMWSLGNESEGYLCQDACYDMMKKLTSIPIHYEGVIHTKRLAYDVISMMYPHLPKVVKIGEGTYGEKFKGKPYFLCEYAHAMGTGPGSLADYVDSFLKYDNIMGGCIWEWADHSVYKYPGNKYEFTYGGDHGEPYHDGNFCVDGLVSPMRKPHTGAYLMQACYRPVRARMEGGSFYLNSIRRFKDTSDIKITYLVEYDGRKADSGEIKEIIPPESEIKLNLKVESQAANVHVKFIYTDKASGREIAREERAVKEGLLPSVKPLSGIKVNIIDGSDRIEAESGSVKYSLNKKTGVMDSIKRGGEELLSTGGRFGQGITENIWRAPTDNDKIVNIAWKTFGYYRAEPRGVKVGVSGNEIKVVKVFKKGLINIYKTLTVYSFGEDGSITVASSIKPSFKFLPPLPRFGMIIPACKKYSNSEYYGLGGKENYPDFKAHTATGIYSGMAVEDYMEPEIRPQDSGSRGNIRYLKVLDKSGKGFVIEAVDKFLNINLSHYPLDNLTEAGHREDLKAADSTYIYVDGFVRGLGSASCGPGPLPEYALKFDKVMTYSFKLRII